MYMISILSQPNKNDGNGDIVIAASFFLFGPREEAGAGSSGEKRERERHRTAVPRLSITFFYAVCVVVVTVGGTGKNSMDVRIAGVCVSGSIDSVQFSSVLV